MSEYSHLPGTELDVGSMLMNKVDVVPIPEDNTYSSGVYSCKRS